MQDIKEQLRIQKDSIAEAKRLIGIDTFVLGFAILAFFLIDPAKKIQNSISIGYIILAVIWMLYSTEKTIRLFRGGR